MFYLSLAGEYQGEEASIPSQINNNSQMNTKTCPIDT